MKSLSSDTKRFRMIGLIVMFLLVISPSFTKSIGVFLYLIAAIVGLISYKYGLLIFIFSTTNLFSLYGRQAAAGNSGFSFQNIATIVSIAMFLQFLYRKHGKLKKTITVPVLVLLFSLYVSVFVAGLRWGQPILRSTLGFRQYLIILSVFPLQDYFSEQRLSIKDLFDTISSWVLLAYIMCLIQYLFFTNSYYLPILYANITHIAFAKASKRYLLHNVAPLVCLLIGYNFFVLRTDDETSVKRVKRIVTMVIFFVVNIVLAQTRIFILSSIFLIAFVETVFVRKKSKYIIFLLGFGVIIIFAKQIAYFLEQTIQSLFIDILEQKDDYIRIRVINYFWDTIKDAWPIFGGGISNIAYQNAPAYWGSLRKYTLSDVGVLGYFYQFGLQGIMGLAFFCRSVVLNINKQEKLIYVVAIMSIVDMIIQMSTVSPAQHLFILILVYAISAVKWYDTIAV